MLLFEIVIFRQKREVFSELARKGFKTTGKHNLAVSGSFCGEKQFLLIFVPFYCFIQKGLFTTNPNVPLDFPLLKLVEKKTFQVFLSFFLGEAFFLLKKRYFQCISPKTLQNNRKA